MDLFPHDVKREIQKEFIDDVEEALISGKNIIAHAPTGLGKTAATLGPALSRALENKQTVFFLTSRHTQHKIAIDTIKLIKEKHNVKIRVVDIIGKKWMCLVPGTDLFYSGEFADYCKKMRENNQCEFFNNTKKGNSPTQKAEEILVHIKKNGLISCNEIIGICDENKLCPYEITGMLTKKADIIVADYNYVFNEKIRNTFFLKSNKSLEESIIIIDEGHNLPQRLREMMTSKLTNNMLRYAIKEAKKHNFTETVEMLSMVQDILNDLSENVKDEKIVSRDEFVDKIKEIKEYDDLAADLTFVGDTIKEKQRQSFVGSIANFMEGWLRDGNGFFRFISIKPGKNGPIVTLQNKCLDPSYVSHEVINESYSTILMSGTLTPTLMYQDILGFSKENTLLKRYKSPFPEDNRLNLVIPKTTTKFSARSEQQYKDIAKICAESVNLVPGNSAIFFPSYKLRNEIYKFFNPLCTKTTFLETPGLSNEEKNEFLESFKGYHKVGAVLLGVASGSFGEGIDLPGEYLKCVIVVGLPLSQPNLETKQLINYYDAKFKRGWDYGYTFPALNKVMQAAGRCIRSSKDKGAIVFLDQRFVWDNYFKCFPIDWDVKVSVNYEQEIKTFFDRIK